MADKSKSIKEVTDKELDELLIRLRKESELQNLIAELKRKSSPNDPYKQESYSRPEISTEQPIESLYHKVDEVLAHYGILGMKWGVRRERGPDGRVVTRGPRKPLAEDYQRTRQRKKQGYKHLSTRELQELTQRLQLEKQLRELSVADASKGMAYVKGATENAKTLATAYAFYRSPLGKGVRDAVDKAIDLIVEKGVIIK